MATLLKVRVGARDCDVCSALLFEVGFSGLTEQAQGASIVLTVGEDSAELTHEKQQVFEARARSAGLSCECWTEELSDAWKTAWIAALEPVMLTETLRLVPHEPQGERLPGDVYLKPALAFGYGEHPTTRMAARFLERHAASKRVLDVGSGTGVLCFVAAHVGAQHALGIDIDEPSVLAARQNAALNGLVERCVFSTAQLGQVGCDFEVAIANIDSLTLARLAPEICARLLPGGWIGLTGILEEQAAVVMRAFEAQGCHFAEQMAEEGWCLLSARR